MVAVKAGAEKRPDKPNLSDVPCRNVCPRDCTRIGWRLAVDDPQGVLAPGHHCCPCFPLTRAPDRRWPRRPVIGDDFENSPHSEDRSGQSYIIEASRPPSRNPQTANAQQRRRHKVLPRVVYDSSITSDSGGPHKRKSPGLTSLKRFKLARSGLATVLHRQRRTWVADDLCEP
jgi:hypothetical protein